jgi:hypothetical protein
MTEPSLSLEPFKALLPAPLIDFYEWPPSTLTLVDVVGKLLRDQLGITAYLGDLLFDRALQRHTPDTGPTTHAGV